MLVPKGNELSQATIVLRIIGSSYNTLAPMRPDYVQHYPIVSGNDKTMAITNQLPHTYTGERKECVWLQFRRITAA